MRRPDFLPVSGAVPRQPVELRRPSRALPGPFPGSRSADGISLTRVPTPGPEAEKIRDAARQFEALFLAYLYQTMRETVPASPFSEGQSGSMYEEMFTPSLGDNMAKGGGIGLAELMVKHFEAGGARTAAAALRNVRAEDIPPGGRSSVTGALGGGYRSDVGHSALPGAFAPAAPNSGLQAAPADRTAVAAPQIGRKKMPELADNVRQALDRAAEQTGVDRDLLQAVVVIESGGNPQAESHRGARGLMQLMAGTARELGVTNIFDPGENVLAGARYLKRMLVAHGGDERLALAAYNAGPGNVRRHGGVPPFPETQKYIERVLDIRKRLGGSAA